MSPTHGATGQPRFTGTAVGLHWLAALLIFVNFPLGLYMADLHLSPLKLRLFSYHKSIGVTVFLLTLARLLWRLGHPAPPLPATIPAWQRRAALGVEHTLYLLVFVIPLSGWLMSSALGMPTVYLAIPALQLPDLLPKDKALGELLEDVHSALNWTMAALLVLHVGAALKHHFVERSDLLIRMAPWLDRGGRP